MRLICPNCDAEYQVDDAAIPEAGRDVQCSNCGHAWFQMPADAEIAREAEEDLFGEAASATAQSAEPVMVPETAVPDPEDDEESLRPAASRQTLAESVLSVLREEAERETAVRREEDQLPRNADQPSSMETQTELGLEGATLSSGASAAARHIARLKGADPDAPLVAEAEPKTAARRDLLPDIEEINSTLRASSERAQADEDDIDALPNIMPRRRGFRSGFVLTMILAVALAMAYVMAPRVIAQIPGSAPTMRAYVAAVDSGRLWIDGLMKAASGSLRSFSGDGN